MRFSTKVFVATFGVACAAVLAASFSVYEIAKKNYVTQYRNLYHERLELVAREFVELEKTYQQLAINAAIIVREREAHQKKPFSTAQLTDIAEEVGVDEISLIGSQGEFLHSSQVSTPENLFRLCPSYQNLIRGESPLQQTPLLPDVKAPSVVAWFTLMPNHNRSKIIDVRVTFDEISKILSSLVEDDSDIVHVAIRAPNGAVLGEVGKQNAPTVAEADSHLSFMIPASISNCCECVVRGLVNEGQSYHYQFTANVSLKSLTASISLLKSRFTWIISALLALSLLLSLWITRILIRKIQTIRTSVDEIAASRDFSKTIPIKNHPADSTPKDELDALALHFNRMFSAMKDAQNEMIEAKKNEARASVASQVAHDIRSPLSSMTLALNRLQTELQSRSSPGTAEMISILSHGISRVNGILKRLSKNYRKEDVGADPVESPRLTLMDKLLFDVAQEHALKIPANQTFKITGFDATPRVWGVVQVAELQTALSNILNNAFEAIPENGIVELLAAIDGQTWRVSVTDNGVGIPESVIDRVFERQFTSGKKEGSGLGLYQAKKAIEWCGGKIAIESHPGKGTTVGFSIPIEKTPSWATDHISMKAAQTLVIADDDPTILLTWREKTKSAGVSIREFSTIQSLDDAFSSLTPVESYVFIVDQYAADGKSGLTGIAFIEKHALGDRARLSTSEFDDPAIQDKIKALKTRMIPKPRLSAVRIVLE